LKLFSSNSKQKMLSDQIEKFLQMILMN